MEQLEGYVLVVETSLLLVIWRRLLLAVELWLERITVVRQPTARAVARLTTVERGPSAILQTESPVNDVLVGVRAAAIVALIDSERLVGMYPS